MEVSETKDDNKCQFLPDTSLSCATFPLPLDPKLHIPFRQCPNLLSLTDLDLLLPTTLNDSFSDHDLLLLLGTFLS